MPWDRCDVSLFSRRCRHLTVCGSNPAAALFVPHTHGKDRRRRLLSIAGLLADGLVGQYPDIAADWRHFRVAESPFPGLAILQHLGRLGELPRDRAAVALEDEIRADRL